MPVMPMTGFGVGTNAAHGEDALAVLDIMLSDEALQIYAETNRVISPSKNVEVECVDPLKPLNDRFRELLGGATVDECMEMFDRLQEEALQKSK